jgi:hypothetical protein
LLYPREEAGMKVALIGYLIAMVGAAIAFLVHISIGALVAACGILIGIAGVVWHWKVNLLE